MRGFFYDALNKRFLMLCLRFRDQELGLKSLCTKKLF